MTALRSWNSGRAAGIGFIAVLTAAAVWFTWPRPDALIRVEPGGVSTVTNSYGFSSPLGDTVIVGGSGPRRTIRIVNDDSVTHQIAMFSIAAGERSDYTVPPGVFGGICTAHPVSRQLTFVVR